MIINTRKYIEEFLKIKTKDAKIIPFRLNAPQEKLYNAIKSQADAGKPQRIIVLKARQIGFSTLTEAVIFKKTATAYNVSSAIVTHKDDATTNLFEMSKRYYKYLPEPLKPQLRLSNAKELLFDTRDGKGFGSRIKCFTAGGDAIGRSDTIQNLHISEYALWAGDKKDTLNGLMQAIPNNPDTLVVIESTANGYDHFKELWDMAVSGENDFVPVFCAWYEMPDYRMPSDELGELTADEKEQKELYKLDNEQIAWRRWCIKNNCANDINLFKQEYPSNPEEAFLTSGECLFDKVSIITQIERVRPLATAQKRGEFHYKKIITPIEVKGEVVGTEEELTDIVFVETPNGLITLHELAKVIDKNNGQIWKEPYALAGDTAGEGSDYYTGKVVSVMGGRTVATLRKQHIDEDKYADQMYCLGKYYHWALIGIETNYSRVPMRRLEALKYPNLYLRERLDQHNDELTKISGFQTTKATKPIIISNLIALMRENPAVECDIDTLKEMLTFVRKENGKQEAQQGYHDDLVMAKAIANFIASQQGEPNWIKEGEVDEPKTIEEWVSEVSAKQNERRYIKW